MYSSDKCYTMMQLTQPGFVDGPRLLELLFPDQACRPSLRWLRHQQKARRLPFVRIGRLVFFDTEQVRNHIRAKTS